jgi:hypothetical protein
MGFYRQLDLLVTTLTTVLAFVSFTFIGGLSVKVSLGVTAVVCLAGLIYGRRIAEILRFFY